MKKTTNAKKTTCPHVKWGSLIIFCLSIIIEIALLVLNIYANTGNLANASIQIGFIAAYGWLVGGLFFLAGGACFFESFLPSFLKMRKWKRYKAYKDSVVQTVRKSLLSNAKKRAEDYEELLNALN